MKPAEYIYPEMISEYAHTKEFALKMKAWSFLKCQRLGINVSKIEALYGITKEVADRYEEEWASLHGYVYEAA
jgi:hypothetical protein